MPKFLGKGQIAECQRSGIKCFAHQLVRDGRNPQLLVLPEWADPPHPQEQAFVTSPTDGKPRFAIAPENLPAVVPPVLAVVSPAVSAALTWSAAETDRAAFETYKVYRALGAEGAFAVITTLEVDFGDAVFYAPVVPSGHTDTTVAPATTYRYRVDALDKYGRTAASNVVSFTAT